jgi:exportin-T
MEHEVDRIVQAILVAADPTQASLHQQALEYLSTIQKNANETWRLALALFVDANTDGSRKHPTQARFFGLRVLDDFLDNRFESMDADSFQMIQQALVNYIRSEFIYGPAEASATCESSRCLVYAG